MNIKGCKSILLTIFTSALLSACDIGPSGLEGAFDEAADTYTTSSSSSSSGATSSSGAATRDIAGTVAKGIINNAQVVVHGFDGGVEMTTPYSITTSNSAGQYTLSIPQTYTGPYVVRVSATDSTTMKCDLADGCGDGSAFGDSVTLSGTELNLSSMSYIGNTVTAPSINTNVTTLTTVASAVALQSIGNLNSITAQNLRTAISNANTSVANRFGLVGDVTQLPVVDITDEDSVAGASDNALLGASLNSAIIEAQMFASNQVTLANAASRFAQLWLDRGGIADTESTFSNDLNLEKILTRVRRTSAAVSNYIPAVANRIARQVARVETRIVQASQGSTIPTGGTPSDPDQADLDKVKAMVAEVRKVGTRLESGFAAEQGLVEAVADINSDHLLQAMTMGASAIGRAYEAHQDDVQLTSYSHEPSGIMVSISVGDDSTVYAIDSLVSPDEQTEVTLALTAVDAGIEQGTSQDPAAETLDGGLTISGIASSSMATLAVENGSSMTIDMLEVVDDNESSVTLDSLALDLSVLLQQTAQASENPAHFSGVLKASLEGIVAAESESATAMASAITFTLGGTFADASGASVQASFSISTNDPEFNFAQEDAESASGSFSLAMTFTTLPEIAPTVSVSVTGERSASGNDYGELTISYGAVVLTSQLDLQAELEQLMITDQNEVVMTLSEDANGEISGTITLEAVEHATIDESSGVLAVAYTDGTNETLW